MSKQFWGIVIIIFAIFGAIFAFSGNKSDDTGTSSDKKTASQHVIGEGSSGVVLLEYGDFQCPYCAQYYPIVKEVKEKYKDQITFQFRNFPLTNAHPNAFAASRAAEAASLQGKFWEMHDILYENQNAWASSSQPLTLFKQYAKTIGLKEQQFATDFASTKVNNTINADYAAGVDAGVTGTPAFFVDGKKVEVSGSVESFEKVLKPAIEKKTKAKQSANPAKTETSATTETTAPATTAGN
jgi:protein-disulfide isomerase